MYCQKCGAAVTPGLNYCNRCGTELEGAKKLSDAQIESLIWAIVGVTVGGISVIIGLMAVMKNVVNFPVEIIAAITFLSFFMILIADAVFVWLLLKRNRASQRPGEDIPLIESKTQKLIDMPAQSELNQPIPSVVEDTTRNLEPVPLKAKSK